MVLAASRSTPAAPAGNDERLCPCRPFRAAPRTLPVPVVEGVDAPSAPARARSGPRDPRRRGGGVDCAAAVWPPNSRWARIRTHWSWTTYGLRSSPIQPGKPHENGVAEQSHFRTKTAVEQALLLRADRDFVDEAAYLRFVRAVGRRGAECGSDATAARGASVSAAVAVGSDPGAHDVPVQGAKVGARSGSAAGSTPCRRG